MKRFVSGIPKKMLFDHPVTKLPESFNRMKKEFIFITLLTAGMNLFSFFLEFGKNQIRSAEEGGGNWHAIVGIILITLYFIKGSLGRSFSIWIDSIEINNDEEITTKINTVVSRMLLLLQGKVFKKNEDTNVLEAMNNNTLLDSSRGYLSTLWRYQVYFISRMAEIAILIIMFLGFSKVSYSAFLITIIGLVSFLVFEMARKRIKFYKSQRDKTKKVDQEKNTWVNDILNVHPVNEQHSNLMIARIVKSFEAKFNLVRFKRKKGNTFSLIESIFLIIAVITIIIHESVTSPAISSAWALDLISLLTIFSTIINDLKNVVDKIERMSTELKDLETYQKDMALILDEYDKVLKTPKIGHPAKVRSMSIPVSTISYRQKGKEIPYSLRIGSEFAFYPGDVVFVTGPTGCGKTTLLRAISGRIKFNDFAIRYDIANDGDIETEFYETDSKMGAGPVLSELVFSEENYDREKLKYLFDNLHITEFLQQRDESDIFEFLKTIKFEDFSNGQRQRLLLARNLYHISDDVITISIDEATSGLNDEICKDVLDFIKNYCKDKIIFISSHQKALTESICNKQIVYSESQNHYEAKLLNCEV